jgi:hypothetical protein
MRRQQTSSSDERAADAELASSAQAMVSLLVRFVRDTANR